MKCMVCGKEFESKRSTAKFCSDKCKKRYQRGLAGQNKEVSGTNDTLKKVSGTNPLKRITRPPYKVYDGYYKSDQYKNLIEELDLKPLKQLREEGYQVPVWKLNGLKRYEVHL